VPLPQLQGRAAGLLLSLRPFLHGGCTGVEIGGEHRLTGLTTQPQMLDLLRTVVLIRFFIVFISQVNSHINQYMN
jgi:hypothetical protein